MRRKKERYSSEHPSMEYLSHRGPYRVAAGEMDEIGLPGIVFAPETGPRCPAVVWAHGYLQPVGRYAGTLRYLASWGFVAAAPAVEGGPLPSHAGLALDVSRTLDCLADTKLGGGRVTVDHTRMAVAGHGIGGGAAVLAARAAAPPVSAVVTVFATETSPSAVAAASTVMVPALHLVAAKDGIASASAGGAALAHAWGGQAQLRRVKGATHLAIAEGKHWTATLTGEDAVARTQRSIRTLTTAFLMLHTAGHGQLADEMEGTVEGTVTS
jgi:pimeloyl-ACP methyl ester carboxylesterase